MVHFLNWRTAWLCLLLAVATPAAGQQKVGPLQRQLNGADIDNPATFRNSLGLGAAKTLNLRTALTSSGGSVNVSIGTTAGTVAAGNDGRITGAFPTTSIPGGALLGGTAGSSFNPVSVGTGLTLSAGTLAANVATVAGRTGAVTLSTVDVSGLGGASTLNVGTTAGTVAAGNDSRITGAFPAASIPTGALLGGTAGSSLNAVSVGTGLTLSAGTLAANVATVAGRTGAVTLSNADVSGLGALATLNVGSNLTNSAGSLGLSTNVAVAGTLSAAGTGTFTGSLIAGNGGSAPITLASGSITAATSQNVTMTTGGAGFSFVVGNSGGGLGNAITITTNTNGNTAGSASPNRVSIGNVLQSPFYTTPGNTYTLTGAQNIQPMLLSTNYAGSTTAALRPYQVNISSDTVDASAAANAPSAFTVTHNVGGAGTKGGRIAFLPMLSVNSAITGDTTSQQYQASYCQSQASVNVGGTNTGSGARGFLYGCGSQAVLYPGATGWGLLNGGGEMDVAAMAGSSVRDIYGMSIVLLAAHAVAGAGENQAIVIASQSGALQSWTRGLGFGNSSGDWSFAPSASLIGTTVQINYGNGARSAQLRPQLATRGVDLSTVNFSQQAGSFLRGPGFNVDGTGAANIAGGLVLGSSAAGYKVDIPAVNVVTAVAVSNPGTGAAGLNNYYPGDVVFGTSTPTPGQYLVTNTKAVSATVVAGGTGGTNGACTATGTTGTGTKFQASGTVTGGILGGALTIAVAGNYTVNPTSLAVEPITGCGLTGATVSLGMGVLTASILVPDVSTGTAATITPTGGSGVGYVITPTWSTRSTLQLQTSGGDSEVGGGLWIKGLGTTGNGTGVAEHQLYGAAGQRKLITFYEENSGYVLRSQIGLNSSNDLIVEQFNASGTSLGMALQVPNATGTPKFGRSGAWSANGSVATTMTSLGPTGSHTTIQEWFTVQNAAGVTRYIPAY